MTTRGIYRDLPKNALQILCGLGAIAAAPDVAIAGVSLVGQMASVRGSQELAHQAGLHQVGNGVDDDSTEGAGIEKSPGRVCREYEAARSIYSEGHLDGTHSCWSRRSRGCGLCSCCPGVLPRTLVS